MQRRIELTPEHRFGEAERIVIEPLTEQATCLIDLDTASAMHLPFTAPRGDELALLLEEHGIDLVVRLVEGELWAQTAGCPLYPISEAQWDQPPLTIVQAVRSEDDQAPFVTRQQNEDYPLVPGPDDVQ